MPLTGQGDTPVGKDAPGGIARRESLPGFERGETAASFLQKLKRKKSIFQKFLLDPRTSSSLGYWDSAGGIILLYTALVTPYEVAFLTGDDSATAFRFILNRAIDLFFLCDMFVQLMVMYPLEKTAAVELVRDDGTDRTSSVAHTRATTVEMISSHRMIASRYLRSWFLIDLVSVLTGLVDILSVSSMSAAASDSDSASSASGLEQLRILRVLRVLRLIKLVRLLKTSRLLKRWQSAFALDYSTQTLISCLLSYLVAGHWFACILVLTTTMYDSPMHTWLAAKGYCKQAPNGPSELRYGATWERQPAPLQEELAHLHDVYCVSSFQLWAGTYYWMMQLISGSAGGDTNQEDLQTGEQLVFILLVVGACLLSSQIVAAFCDVMSNLSPENTTFRNRMDQLNRYCRDKKLATKERRQLRDYLFRTKSVQFRESQRELMDHLSPKLKGELSLQVNGPWLTLVPFLRRVETECSVRVALALRSRVYIPTEMLPADCMYMLGSGMIVHRGKVVGGGNIWGADCILCRIDLRSRPARALTYVEVDMVHRDVLLDIIYSNFSRTNPDGSDVVVLEFPIAVHRIRWYTVMLGMLREYQRLRSRLMENGRGRKGSPSDGHNRKILYSAWKRTFDGMDSMEDASANAMGMRAQSNGEHKGGVQSSNGALRHASIDLLWKPPVEVQLWA